MIDLEERQPECKGLFYRMRLNQYLGGRGEFVAKTTFTPLKRMSCKGCCSCDGIMEYLKELAYERDFGPVWNLKDEEDYAIFQLDITNMSTDWETGIVDDWDLEFVKVER